MVGARAKEVFEKLAKERQRAAGGDKTKGALPANLPEAVSSGDARDMAGKAVGVSGKSIDHATKVIKLRAERKAGELLLKMEKQNGARGKGKKVESHDVTPLSEIGITKMQSSRWQAEAKVPEKQFQQLVEECRLPKRSAVQA